MKFSQEELIQGVFARDYRALARVISLVENRSPRIGALQAELFKKTGHAHIIGVTGSPGAGKSTLVDSLAGVIRASGKSVAILAVDPSSPFSGGAILGDRIRMARTAEDSEVYIRSMATRGALGGLARATLDAVHVLDAAGFDYVLVETVGVGQAEVDVVRTADTCAVVLVPGMGDSVQAVKAGILEIADIFVVNKADRDGTDLLLRDIRMLLTLGDHDAESWLPPIVSTIATTGQGVLELLSEARKHHDWLGQSHHGEEKRSAVLRDKLLQIVAECAVDAVLEHGEDRLNSLVKDCLSRKVDPYTAAKGLLQIK